MKRGHIYHVYYRRSGGYKFLGKNTIRLIVVLAIIGIAAFLFNKYVYDLEKATQYITTNFSKPGVLSTLFLSEVSLGLIAPEVFIAWAAGFELPWIWLFIMATISYIGGLIAYGYGRRLDRLPRVHKWVHEKFADQFKQLKKFGGLLIVVAAFTPLPYPPICMVSGVIKFPFKSFLVLTLSRYLRFVIYGAIIFKAL